MQKIKKKNQTYPVISLSLTMLFISSRLCIKVSLSLILSGIKINLRDLIVSKWASNSSSFPMLPSEDVHQFSSKTPQIPIQ